MTTGASHEVMKFTQEGRLIGSFGRDKLSFTGSIVIDDEGNIYVGDEYSEKIKKFTNNGEFLLEFYGGFPSDMAKDFDGDILVMDAKHKKVLKFNKEGELIDSKKMQILNNDLHKYLLTTKVFHIIKTSLIFILAISLFIFNIKMGFIPKGWEDWKDFYLKG